MTRYRYRLTTTTPMTRPIPSHVRRWHRAYQTYSYRQVAQRFGVSPETVRLAFQRHGLPTRPTGTRTPWQVQQEAKARVRRLKAALEAAR